MLNIFGHRGCKSKKGVAENSLAAFAAAISEGADGIELDVFLTTDNVLVVFHDDTLTNLSSGHGAIGENSLAQLKQLSLRERAGSDVFTNDKIPTLDEVLNLVESFRISNADRFKDFKVCIEIKGLGIAREVSEYIERRLATGNWAIGNFEVRSFDMASLNEMKDVMPSLQLGILFEGGKYPWDINEEQLAEKLLANKNLFEQPEKVSPNNTVSITLNSMTDAALQIIAHIAGINPHDGKPMVTPWTAGEKNPNELNLVERRLLFNKLEKLIGVGSAFITDFPGEIIDFLSERELSRGWQVRTGETTSGRPVGLK